MADENTPLRIDIELLEQRKIQAKQDRDADVSREEAEIRQRWMALMTPEYIMEKIADASADGYFQVMLIDEDAIDGVNYYSIGRDVARHVQSILDKPYQVSFTGIGGNGIHVEWYTCHDRLQDCKKDWPCVVFLFVLVITGTSLLLLWISRNFSSDTNHTKS